MEYQVINSRGRKVRARFKSIESARQYFIDRGKNGWSVQVIPSNVTHFRTGVAQVGIIRIFLADGSFGTVQRKRSY